MKTCGYCGNEYDDREPKCPQCGATVLKHTKGAESAAEEYKRLEKQFHKDRAIRSKILGIGAAAIVLVIVIIISNIVGFVNDPQRDIAKESKELLSQAEQQMDAGNYDEALDTLGRIDTAWDDYSKVVDTRLEAVKGQLKAKLAEYEAAGNYQAIISMINENVTDINADAEVKAAYESAVRNYKAEVISSAEEYAADGDYTSARSALTVAKNFIGEDVEISEKLKEINQKEVLEVALSYEAEGNYKDAIVYLNENSSVVSGSADLQAKLSTYAEKYRTNVISEAASEYKENGYEAAVLVLNSALGVLPNDEQLNSEKVKYELAVPVPLIELDVTKQGEYLYVGNTVDSFNSPLFNNIGELCKDVNGNQYSSDGVHYVTHFRLYEEGEEYRSITYYLNQEYDVLTGMLYRPYITLHCNFDWTSDGRVDIYGDGVLLYSASLSQNVYDPIECEVDITGVRELQIRFDGKWRNDEQSYFKPKICLANLEVAKKP